MTAQVISMSTAKPRRTKQIVTGPEMILIFWIARVAMEDRDAYEYVTRELKIKGDEAARLYNVIRDFLGD